MNNTFPPENRPTLSLRLAELPRITRNRCLERPVNRLTLFFATRPIFARKVVAVSALGTTLVFFAFHLTR